MRWTTALVGCAAITLVLPAPATPQTPDGARTRVVLLGTGTPNPDPARSGPASAVVVNGASYLVDCGPGVVRRAAAAANEKGIDALRAPSLRQVFVTHLHSDHTVGCPDLMLSPWVLGRDAPLEIYGPPGTRRMVDHGSWEHAYGYRFETADRTIVFSGDTGPTDAVVEACDGCDVLVHEVYSAVAFRRRAPEWRRYHASFHTSTRELAGIAARARPGLLVLNHQLFWGVSDDALVAEIRELYEGDVVSGRDLDVY